MGGNKVSPAPRYQTVAIAGKQWKRRVNNVYKREKAVQLARKEGQRG